MAKRKTRGIWNRDGTYWIDFTYQGKRHRRAAGGSRQKAEDSLSIIKAKIARGEFDPDELDGDKPGIAFETAAGIYVEHRTAEGKRRSSYEYLSRIRELEAEEKAPETWEDVFKGRELHSIASEEIAGKLSEWSTARKLAPAARNRMLSQLSGLFSFAYRCQWIERHPTERGRVPKLTEDNARTRWLRAHEVQAIYDKAPEWMQPIVLFAAATGMRLGEICTLRRANYHVDDEGRAVVVTEKTKNGERLLWPLEGWVLDHVQARVQACRFPADYLFPGPEGQGARKAIARSLPGIIEAAKLRYGRKHEDGITFHTFRHSMASLALNSGVPESTVQKMGNWKKRDMVSRYAHLADATMREAAGKLARLVVPRHAYVTIGDKAAPNVSEPDAVTDTAISS